MYHGHNAGPGRRQGNGIGRMVRNFFAGLLLFLVVFALATLDKRAAHSAPGIGPVEEIMMHLEYQQLLRGNGADTSLRFPLVAAPRRRSAPPLHNVKFDGRAGVPGPNPQTRDRAGNSTRGWTLTVMALMFSVMMALTLELWRQLGYAVVGRRGARRV